jgi:hypothetical protein
MRAALIALMLTFATQAGAECGKPYDHKCLRTATTADLQAELDAGADVMTWNKGGYTPSTSIRGSLKQHKFKLGLLQRPIQDTWIWREDIMEKAT